MTSPILQPLLCIAIKGWRNFPVKGQSRQSLSKSGSVSVSSRVLEFCEQFFPCSIYCTVYRVNSTGKWKNSLVEVR